MKLKLIILFVLLMTKIGVFAQEYSVSLESTNKAIALTNQGMIKLKDNLMQDAFKLLIEAISIDSTFRNPYLQLYTVAMNDSTKIDTAISILQKSKKIFQQDDEICYYLGEMYKAKGEVKRAMAGYSMAIAYSKMNGEDFYLVHKYYFNRANICLEKNMISTAVLDYTYALNLKPDYGVAFANRGICFFKMGEIEAACKDWKQAVKLGVSQSEEYIGKNCQTEVPQ
ncbi:tetratricopeptide repeat protein [Labilibaculum sp. K2S]|uniref:tetratricopeptide repeat protein n=1 Tax=Labilibaculum sp. K2S TaxID=3056386 RepID=UPI0025A3CE8B|nr:tetratricopeptide repeat protein [Labilibaculum sp. K2S]MDM8160139.1 tetratricopeptide repeat protein [Labilibaculum sp. K2S]